MTSIVQEGRAKLVVDNEGETESFYNPVMQFNRDLTWVLINLLRF